MTQRVSLGDGFEKHLSPEDFYLYVTSHEYKHYSAGGTGLRSVLDTYVYLQKAAPDMDYVTAEAEKLGMAEFEAANRSLAMHLFSGAALTEADKEMLNYILDSGVYGTLNHQVENAMSRHGWGKIQYALHFFGSEAFFSSRTDELSILLRIWYDMGIGKERRESGVLTPEPKLGEKSMAEFQYQLNYDEASYTMIGYQGKDEHVVIPGTFGGKPVTILYDKLFLGHEEIRSVTIPDSVTDLGEFLFDGCVNLHHLRLPKNLLYLWGYTFVRCGLEEIELPDLLTSIPSYAFKECSQLKRVVCGSGMKKIYPWAFGGCTRLTELVHGPGVDVSPQAFDLNSAILKV